MNAIDLVAPVAAKIRANSAAVEEARKLPSDLFETVKDARLFAIYTPKEFGGLGLPLPDALRVVEEVSRHDGSTGWTVALGFGNDVFTSCLPDATAREALGDGSALLAGSAGFEVQARAVEGGYRISGQWQFVSGASNAGWVNVAAPIFDGPGPRMGPHGMPEMVLAFMKPGDVEIVDTWNTTGLRGTASHDVRADDLFVPVEWTGGFSMAGAVPLRASVLARIPMMTMVAAVQAPPVCLGLASRALEEFIALAKGKERMYAAKPADQPAVHSAIARAEAGVRAARSYYYETVSALHSSVAGGSEVSLADKVEMRMACLNAVEQSLDMVDACYRLAGSTSIFRASPIERCWRDAHTAAQHVQVQDARWVTAGRVLFGLEPDGPMF
jgi:indole-3-acetate monooxygenase